MMMTIKDKNRKKKKKKNLQPKGLSGNWAVTSILVVTGSPLV
jgi:hypothetical protein